MVLCKNSTHWSTSRASSALGTMPCISARIADCWVRADEANPWAAMEDPAIQDEQASPSLPLPHATVRLVEVVELVEAEELQGAVLPWEVLTWGAPESVAQPTAQP